ncbi:hypothetical protein Syun_011630 [Stephania yunnanensis]|uniref:Plant regulator RWP-RK n=1 Tax=Stephania yunnanensis TaxID=152371 RepID=A0AAP0K044_9MAGN
MGTVHKLVCVKKVKQNAAEEWNESMPLPGDIIEGVAAKEGEDEYYIPAKARSELSSSLGKLSKSVLEVGGTAWVKIRRGDATLKLRVYVVQERSSKFQRRFTIRAASDDRHVAVLGNLTYEQCSQLQELSRKVVNTEERGLSKKEVKYDWKKVVGNYLPDQRSTVISSVLFMPLAGEHRVEATTARCMAWFSAAISSGVPLIFVNIQTEQIITSERTTSGGDACWAMQQSYTTTIATAQGVRLWFLPGVAEMSVVLRPERGETRFGMDIKRTEEGFICIYTVAKRTAADRAGLRHLHEQARESGQLLVLSRLEGKSLVPSTVSSTGLIQCCDNAEVKDFLASAINNMDLIHLHVMTWPNFKASTAASQVTGIDTIKPPQEGPRPVPMSSVSRINSRRGLLRDQNQPIASDCPGNWCT